MQISEKVFEQYLAPFACESPFLHYYSIGEDKKLQQQTFSRGEFLCLSRKTNTVFMNCGLNRGDHFINCVGANHYQDLAFRLGSVMLNLTPATVNWQADNLERIKYKIDTTDAKLILYDSIFCSDILNELRKSYPNCHFFNIEDLDDQPESEFPIDRATANSEDTRIIIFTSGTTGTPKGVKLPYLAYETNRATFETMLGIEPDDKLALLIVNPMHHTNSTAITDWGLRRPGAEIHIVERYSTQYWKLNRDIANGDYDRVVAPLVAKHFDFLESLNSKNSLPLPLDSLTKAMAKIDYLIGSAPVGPTTIKRLLKFAGRVPTVRFGSTETCLQVMGIPAYLPEDVKIRAFEAGWDHKFNEQNIVGYYIGRPTPPYTECRIVKAIERGSAGYFEDCSSGEPGYLVNRGKNLMTGYLGNQKATEEVFHEGGWYSGLKDICFALKNTDDGKLDFYWQGRDSFLLIKGGANYSYDQINSELETFAETYFGLDRNSFEIAVVGLQLDSEHEDTCCATMQLKTQLPDSKINLIKNQFISLAKKNVSKGAVPDYFRFGDISKNFKGAVLVSELKKCFSEFIKWQKNN